MQVSPQFMHNFGFIMMFLENMNRYADLASKALQDSSSLLDHLKLGKILYHCVDSHLLSVAKMLYSHLLQC